jgi:2-keto-4-pentenoate hydratase
MSAVSARSPLQAAEVLELAERQLADYRRGSPGTVFAEGTELSIEDAYAVQRVVARLRVADGEAPAGYKVGCTGQHVQTQFGMPGPVSGHLWRDELRPSGSWVAASRFTNLAVEAEVAATLDEHGEIAAVFPVIELHDYVLRGTPPTLAELVANNAFHAGVVVPRDTSGLPAAISPEEQLELEVDGELVGAGPPFPMEGGAEASLRWLRTHLATLGAELRPRSLVLLGTPLHLVPVAPGAQVCARVGGMSTRASITG